MYRPGGMIYSNPSPRPGRPNGWGFCKKIDRKPGQRLLASLSKQGLQPNQQITFLLGGACFQLLRHWSQSVRSCRLFTKLQALRTLTGTTYLDTLASSTRHAARSYQDEIIPKDTADAGAAYCNRWRGRGYRYSKILA